MGHPEPFNLKMMGVGNEQWGQQYIDRYAKFAAALKARYPDLQLVSAAGPEPADKRFQFAWSNLRELHADIIDEHCYALPEWFYANTRRYDTYDRTGPKVFMGEYAAQSVGVVSTKNKNNMGCALAEAAYLTGLERNADVVRLASYAPLFANTEAWQWTPDMIWVDSLRINRTPNYFVQQLFSCNRGDVVLPVTVAGTDSAPALFASATHDDTTGEIILKVVNPETTARAVTINLAGVANVEPEARAIVLRGDSKDDVNTIGQPAAVAPVESPVTIAGPTFQQELAPLSVTVLRVKAR
jgi:alpha-N-arabinofuranosidase